MRIFVMRRAVFALLSAILVTAPSLSQAAPPLLLTFKNETTHPFDDIYVGFVGGADATLTATNVATGAALALSRYKSEHWYRLSQLPSGIYLYRFSGRIYIGYGKAWTIVRNGYEPSPSSTSDPNYKLRYDKVEITYTGAAADVANTTSIDYFSIPVTLRVYRGGVSGELVGSVTASARDKIVAALVNATSPARAALVKNDTDNFVRVVGPPSYPPPPGLPASHYDNFDAYLTYLRDTFAPAHGNVVASVKGRFAGVGSETMPQTKNQTYDFAATIDRQKDITLTGSGSAVGRHTLSLLYADLVAPSGIYGANPLYSLDGAAQTNPKNDVYGWIIGDLLSGLNIGAVGSNVRSGGSTVGQLASSDWFKLKSLYSALQPQHGNFYNQYAAALAPVTQAYSFAYSDRFAHVVVPLNPLAVDTMQIVFRSEFGTQ